MVEQTGTGNDEDPCNKFGNRGYGINIYQENMKSKVGTKTKKLGNEETQKRRKKEIKKWRN